MQCTNGAGVCPDAISNAGSTCKENNFDVRGCVQNGVSCVTYSRHLATGESQKWELLHHCQYMHVYALAVYSVLCDEVHPNYVSM